MATKRLPNNAASMLKDQVEKNKETFYGRSEDFPHVVELDVGKVHPDPENARQFFDPEKMEGLKSSIREKGQRSPIWVRPHPSIDNEYILIAGERRWRAIRDIGKPTIFALIYEDEDAAVLAAIENMGREDLTPLEEANYLVLLHKQRGYTQAELGSMIGKSQSMISRIMAIGDLPSSILADLRADQHGVSKSILLEICNAPSEEQQLSLWEEVKGGATVAAIRERKKSAGGENAAERPAGSGGPREAVVAWHRSTRSFERHLTDLRDKKATLSDEDKTLLASVKDEIEALLADGGEGEDGG